jgi:hypothetical protein
MTRYKKTPRTKRTRRYAIISIFALVAILVVTSIFVVDGSIKSVVATKLKDPSLLDGSVVIEGNPFDFVFGTFLDASPAARLRLTKKATTEFLAMDVTFNDCHDVVRKCSRDWSGNPPWAADLNNRAIPPIAAICRWSYSSQTRNNVHAIFICLDQKHRALYYYEVSTDSWR